MEFIHRRECFIVQKPPSLEKLEWCDSGVEKSLKNHCGGPCESHSLADRRWTVHLDRDLFHFLVTLYPDWFEDRMSSEMLSEHEGSDKSEDNSSSDSESSPPSPPRVDDSPLQKCMDRNKQSLKVKLMMRRPYMQLVDQGIMPPLKTPASFHEQRQKLQRAKMGDLLKHKIQHRPDRTELIRQHILEADTGKVDPSLAERQRMLKRARLADSLNDQLSHRPGPLELIQKNILHTDENVERAVKEGQIAFRATCEGSAIRPSHPIRYVTPEADDSSSEGALSPSQDGSLDGCPSTSSVTGGSVSNAALSASGASPATIASSPGSLSSIASPAAPLALAPSPPPAPPPPPPPMPTPQPQQKMEQSAPPPPPPPPPLPVVPSSSSSSSSSPVVVKTALDITKNRNRKKSKQKCPPKPRTIKFHEYKGPPNAQKQQPAAPSDVETSYELLLQQQQLFLQWQLEWQHKYPQIILPANKPPSSSSLSSGNAPTSIGEVPANLTAILSANTVLAAAATPATTATNSTTSSISTIAALPSSSAPSESSTFSASGPRSRLEDMKVSDLKAELKKRNLPVSGSKPQLIDRLRPFINEEGAPSTNRSVSRRGSQSQLQQQQLAAQSVLMADDGPVPSPPLASSSASRRVSCSSLDGSISSFRAGSSDMLLPSLSPTSSAASCSMSPSPCSVRPPSVINMDMDIEMNDATHTLDGTEAKLEAPPTPPPLPSDHQQQQQQQQLPGDQQIEDLVRGLQEEQRILLEQQNILRQQTSASIQEEDEHQQPQQLILTASNDPKTQQRLLIQQHLQLKIQQQQIQQQLEQLQQLQQQSPSNSPSGSRTTASRMAARANRNAAKMQASRQTLASANSNNVNNGNHAMTSPQSITDSSDQKYGSSPSPSDATLARRPPPPNYSEASRMLQHPAKHSSSSSSSSSGGVLKPRVSIKSQLVDDVLDILIRNGELPPSAAHDPITPTTPRDPPPMPPPLPPQLLTKQQQQSSLSDPVVVSSAEIKFPYIDINELGLNLDLDSLGEAMELGVYDNHQSAGQHQQTVAATVPSSTDGRNDEVTAMEMDVSDWLDTLLPPLNGSQSLPLSSNSSVASSTSSTTSGFSSLGSDPHPFLLHQQQQQQQQQLLQQQQQQGYSHHSNQLTQQPPPSSSPHQQISGDPLFSSLSSDPYTDLFSLDDSDMKLPTGLGNTLSWDRLDFTA
uniref:EOG090X04KW n=1 Tax=Scapholeberis mucronata TaxID=202097 RepID=A0A4Y7NK75_9CRUS|nr:EOG090X04KW [Scapholeberis mucronata]SVE93562.1 EOG090X04KW [Scapholeberis mucronata]